MKIVSMPLFHSFDLEHVLDTDDFSSVHTSGLRLFSISASIFHFQLFLSWVGGRMYRSPLPLYSSLTNFWLGTDLVKVWGAGWWVGSFFYKIFFDTFFFFSPRRLFGPIFILFLFRGWVGGSIVPLPSCLLTSLTST